MGGAEAGVGGGRRRAAAGGRHAERGGRIGALSAPPAATARRLERGADAYPTSLEALADPPPRVFVWGGELPAPRACAAIVGSRAATPYGLAIAGRLARDLAGAGVTVV